MTDARQRARGPSIDMFVAVQTRHQAVGMGRGLSP